MKKLSLILFFILSLFFTASFVAPSHTAAQPTNKFDCEWVPGSPGFCRVNLSSVACAPDFCNNPVACATSDQSSCERRAGQDCILCVDPPPPIPFPGEGGGADNLCGGGESIDTAIGCIPVGDTGSFAGWILRWAIGIAGGIAFILIIFAGFMISTSAGDPKRLQAGRELLTSAIAGLLLVIFATFILRLIGVDILGLFA